MEVEVEVEVEVVEVVVAVVVVVVAAHHLQELQRLDGEVAVHEVGGAVLRPRRRGAFAGGDLRPAKNLGRSTARESDGLGVDGDPRTWHEGLID